MDVLFTILSAATLAAMIRAATPLALAAMGGIFSERGGVINIALEGIMLTGAFTAVLFSYFGDSLGWNQTSSALLGVAAAVVFGVAIALIHAYFSITLRVNQLVSGVAINLLAFGISGLLLQQVFDVSGNSPAVPDMKPLPIPLLSDIPFFGTILFDHQPIVYVMLISVPISAYIIKRTTFGLRLRAAGDKPEAIDTVGVDVHRLRYIGVAMSGMFAGLAGAYLSLGQLNFFSEGMTAGRGFIALAAVIFGGWRPWPAFGAALLFGFSDAAQIALQNSGVSVPSDFLLMAPYVITLVALAGFIKKAVPPAAIGQPYPLEETV
jgi:general nucleoside transport system permease protein